MPPSPHPSPHPVRLDARPLARARPQQVNAFNLSTSEVAELWASYMRNVQWNLQSQKTLHPPV